MHPRALLARLLPNTVCEPPAIMPPWGKRCPFGHQKGIKRRAKGHLSHPQRYTLIINKLSKLNFSCIPYVFHIWQTHRQGGNYLRR